MGTILKVNGTEIKNDTSALIACILMRNIMEGIWVERLNKGDSEHKAGTYQIVRPSRGGKQKVIEAVEKIVNGCSGLERNIAYMEINAIWNGRKCCNELEALEKHVATLGLVDSNNLKLVKDDIRECVDIIDSTSETKGIAKFIKLAIMYIKFGRAAKKFVKLVKSLFKTHNFTVDLDINYNLKRNVVEMDVEVNNKLMHYDAEAKSAELGEPFIEVPVTVEKEA